MTAQISRKRTTLVVKTTNIDAIRKLTDPNHDIVLGLKLV